MCSDGYQGRKSDVRTSMLPLMGYRLSLLLLSRMEARLSVALCTKETFATRTQVPRDIRWCLYHDAPRVSYLEANLSLGIGAFLSLKKLASIVLFSAIEK